MLLEQTSPRPFRKVDDNPEEDHEPLSKSRKESAHSSPSKTVAADESNQQVRFFFCLDVNRKSSRSHLLLSHDMNYVEGLSICVTDV